MTLEPAAVAVTVVAWIALQVSNLARWRRIDEGALVPRGLSWSFQRVWNDRCWYLAVLFGWRRRYQRLEGPRFRGCRSWVVLWVKWNPLLMCLEPELTRAPR